MINCIEEKCIVSPCGEDCDYISASIMLGVSEYLVRRSTARKETGHNESYGCIMCEGECILRPPTDFEWQGFYCD